MTAPNSRTDALRKLLAFGNLTRGEIDQAMGGDRADIQAALDELLQSGDVIRRGSSYGVPMFSLSEPARACAFVVENIDIGASYPIPAQRVYAQPIQVFNITEESPCS